MLHVTPKRIGIIGAGPGGLAAAMLLASAGCDVTVHERRDQVGGRCGLHRDRGFTFDIGPTFFLYPQVLEQIFAACGRRLENEIELIRLDPHYRLIFGEGGQMDAMPDLEKLAEQVARLSPTDAAALPRFMADNRRKLKAFKPVLESPFNGPADLLRGSMLKALRWLRPQHSVDSDLALYFKDPRVRLAFSFQSKYLGMSPFRCPSLFTILSFLEYEYGVFHPRGGCGAVMDAMARVAREMGVKIRLNDPVERILFEGRKATGVQVGPERMQYDAMVVNADFANAMSNLVPNNLRRRWSDEQLQKKNYSCSTFMLYLGLRGEMPDLAHHTIWLSPDYRANLAEIEAGRALPGDPSFYVQNACVTDPSMAPPGYSTLYMLLPVGHLRQDGVDWSRQQTLFRHMAIQRLEKLGLRDVENRIVCEKIMTPRDWRDDMQVYNGATFNLAHGLGQMLHRRPRNRFEDLENVYLVGGGTHPGSGLPVIFEGARISCDLMAEDLNIRAGWKHPVGLPTPSPSILVDA